MFHRAARRVAHSYQRADRTALRLASRAVPAKTRQHIQAQRELFGGDLHVGVPVGRERTMAVRIPDRLKHFRHAILPAALLVTLLVALQANAAVTGYGGTHTVSATGDQTAYEAQAYNDSLYASGTLQGSADFGASYGASDIRAAAGAGGTAYVSKTTAGSYNWTRVFTDDTDNISMADIYAGANGASGGEAVYVTGEFTGEINFAADFGGSDIKTAVGNQDGYITRVNADGSYGWTYTFGTAGSYAQPSGITYDPAAAVVVVTGTFGADIQFGPSSPVRTAAASNGFVLWLDDNVTSAAYARDYHLASSTDIAPESIAMAASEVLVGGQFETDATFEMGGAPVAAPSTGSDGFLLKLGLDGTYSDVQSFGGTGQETVTDLQATADGTAYVAGTMTAGAIFRDVGAVSASTNATESYVLQVSPSDVNMWVRVFGDDNTQTRIEGISIGSEGTVYAVGTYNGSVDFAQTFGGSDVQQSHGTTSGFLTTFSNAAYDATYTIGAEAADDPAGAVSSYAVAGSNPDELLYVVGGFTETVDFGLPFAESDAIMSGGGTDAYTTAIVTRVPRTLSGGGLHYFDGDTNLSSSGTQELSPLVTVMDDDDTYLAELTVDMAENREWTTTGDTDHVGYKSVIANLTNQTGAGGTFTLYVPKGAGDKAVAICPGAETLPAVAPDCATRQTFVEGASVTVQNIAGIDYWVLAGRTETSIGAMSLAYPGLAITPPAGGPGVTEGSGVTFSVALQAAPTGDVTLTPNVDMPAQLSGGSALTFTTENWQTPQDLVFTAVDDQLVDGPIDVTLSWTLASTDTNYNGAAEPSIVLQVLDNDEAGIAWLPTSLLLSEAGAATPSDLCITLAAQPTDAVTLTLSSSDVSEATISSPLVIAPEDWDAATNCATVTPVDDEETDGSKDTILSITAVTSGDAAFASLSTASLATVTASVQDDDIAGFVFSANGASQTTEAGGTDQICVALTAAPLASVTVPLSSSDTSEGTLSGTEFIIAPEDWDAATNCITVTGQNDDLIDGNIAYSVLTGDPTSADPAWDALGEADTTNPSLTNLDDDSAGITISESNLVITEGGATDTFHVSLQSQPASGQEVHIAVTSSNTNQLTAAPTALTFTSSDWASPQTVTVTAVDDGILEGAHDGYVSVSVLESSTEEPYLLLGDQTVVADIVDNDSAVVSVQATSNANENGANGAFTVTLSKQNDTASAISVDYDVLLASTAVAGTHYTALSGSVSIPVGQSSADIAVNVAGHNNELLEGDRSVQLELTGTSAGNVALGAAATASALIIDDETATVSLTATPGEEGGSSVILTATLSRANNTGNDMVFELAEAGGTATPGTDYTSFDSSAITISDGATTGTLTIVVADDELLEPATESVAAELSSFPLPPSVGLDSEDFGAQTTIADNDQADVTITASDAAEPATAGSFTLQLSKTNQTGTPITVTFTVVGTATSGTDFTAIGTTANIPDGEDSVIVALTPIDDTDIEVAETVGLTLTETDFGRALVGVPGSASATITDNETAGVTVTTPDDTTGEDAATGQICFELTSRPAADVTIALSSSDSSKVSLPADVAVGRDNWDAPTCITTTGHDDTPPAVTGTVDVTIITGDVTSSDTFYEALGAGDVADATMHHADNDAPSVTVQTVSSVTSEDASKEAVLRFSLSSQPTNDVTIPVSVSDATEGGLNSIVTVVIAPADWNNPSANQLTIYGTDDALVDSTVAYTLTTGTTSSSDSNYNALAVDDVNLTNEDDDAAGVTIDISGDTAVEGASLTHTIAIASQPAGAEQVVVTATPTNNQIALDGSQPGEPVTLTFTNANWSTAQNISVLAADDSLLELAHASAVTYAIAGTTTDPAYEEYAISPATRAVTITDNDTAAATLSATDTGEDASMTFVVTLDKPNTTGSAISFGFDTTASGSAAAGDDFTAVANGTISVANGSSTGTLAVTIADDELLEGDETLAAQITSSSTTAVTIVGADASATITDNDTAMATITATDGTAAENPADNGQFTVSLDTINNTPGAITVSYDVSGSATANEDFAALSGIATIATGQSSTTLSVDTAGRNDELVEGNETVTLTLTEADHTLVSVDGSPATVTIADDDSYVWSLVEIAPGTEAGATPAQFKVVLNKPNNTGADMSIGVVDTLTGSATSAVDYAAFAATATIVPGGTESAPLSITVVDDTVLENTEDIDIALGTPDVDQGVVDAGAGTLTLGLTDNDAANAVLSVTNADEADDLTFTVTLDKTNATHAPVTMTFNTLEGTALEGSDFAGQADATISIAHGSATGTATVTAADDALLEADEALTGTISSISHSGVTITGASAVATIVDNDTATASVTANDASAAENPADSGQFTVSLDKVNNTGAPIDVTYTITGSATPNEDYIALPGNATIANGQSGVSIDVDTSGMDDEVVEGNETIIVTLTATDQPLVSTSSTPATATIADDDSYLWSVAATTNGLEAGSAAVVLTVSLNRPNATGGDMTITLTDPLEGNTATSAQDYTAFGGLVAIAHGETEATITIPVTDDALLEASEQFAAVISAPNEGDIDIATTTATITDNDTASVTLSAADATESDNLVFTATLDTANNTGGDITFDFATSDGTALAGSDYTASTTTISIADGSSTATAVVSVTDDSDLEGDETLTGTIGASNNPAVTVAGASAAATIEDNDTATATVAATTPAAAENPSGNGAFTVSLGIPNMTGAPITVNFAVSGSATAGEDYENLDTTAMIAPEATNAVVTIDTNLFNDSIVEGDETVVVTLASTSLPALVGVNTTPAAVTIADDDSYSWGIAKQQDGAETSSVAASFRASLNHTNTSGAPMTATLTTSGTATSAADYAAPTTTATIPDGEDYADITVAVIDDALLESTEDITVTLSDPSEGTIGTAAATAAITDNDTASAALTTSNIAENAGDATFTATLDKANNTSAPITFALNTTSGTATAGTDYAALTAVSVSIPIGSLTASVTTEIADDALLEGDETATATLSASSNPAVAIGTAVATATILDNETATASIVATTPSVPEGAATPGSFTISLSRVNNTPAPITLNYSVDGTATAGEDYTALSGSVDIAVGESTAAVGVDASSEDTAAESVETIITTLDSTSAPSLVTIGGQNEATMTITDNDTLSWALTKFQDGAEQGAEDIVFRVQLSQPNSTGSDLTATVTDQGSGSAAADDYAAFGSSVTIAPGAEYADVHVAVLDDARLERSETVAAALSDISEGDLAVSNATALITDNDTAVLSITANQPSAQENPSANGQFTISLDKPNESTAPVIIAYSVAGSAVGGTDYALLSGTANIPAGEQSATVWVDMTDFNDTLYEPDETVILTLSATDHSGVSLATPASATVTVQSDDAQPPTPAPKPDDPITIAPQPPTIFVPLPQQPAGTTEPKADLPTPTTPPVDQTAKDQDADGLDDATEAKAHNFGDGNGDGIPDNMQANVSSMVSEVTQRPVTLAAMGDCTDITSFTVVGEGELDKTDLTHRYPHGLVDYALDCDKPGQSADVAVYYDEQLDSGFTWRKLAQPTLEFQVIDSAEPALRAVGQGDVTVISYAVSDGGNLDDDGKTDGKILDPAGLAVSIFQPRDLLWLTPVLLLAGVLIARAGAHHHREHKASRAKIAKF